MSERKRAALTEIFGQPIRAKLPRTETEETLPNTVMEETPGHTYAVVSIISGDEDSGDGNDEHFADAFPDRQGSSASLDVPPGQPTSGAAAVEDDEDRRSETTIIPDGYQVGLEQGELPQGDQAEGDQAPDDQPPSDDRKSDQDKGDHEKSDQEKGGQEQGDDESWWQEWQEGQQKRKTEDDAQGGWYCDWYDAQGDWDGEWYEKEPPAKRSKQQHTWYGEKDDFWNLWCGYEDGQRGNSWYGEDNEHEHGDEAWHGYNSWHGDNTWHGNSWHEDAWNDQ